jgi:hypothetical protein
MKHFDIEAWALRVIDQVRRGQPNEDARVEIKAAWPNDPYKAARQIAAHANPAQGQPILWLIGVDQKGAIPGADHLELAKWYQQVESYFDELAPSVTDVNVPVEGKTVVALLFNTERRPFVVKTLGGPVTHEVPWRGSTSTRSAKRADLVRLLSKVKHPPRWEVIDGELTVERLENPQRPIKFNHYWSVKVKLYVMPEDPSPTCIPIHYCSGTLEFPDFGSKFELTDIRLMPFDLGSGNLKGTRSELLIEGPGMVNLQAEGRSTYMGMLPHTPGHLSVVLRSSDGGYSETLKAVFNFDETAKQWILL